MLFVSNRCYRQHCLAVIYSRFVLLWVDKIFWINFVYKGPIFSMALSKRPSVEIDLSWLVVFASKARSFCANQLILGSSLIYWSAVLIDHTIIHLIHWVQGIEPWNYFALWYLFRKQVVSLDSTNLSYTEIDDISLTWAVFVANQRNFLTTGIVMNYAST